MKLEISAYSHVGGKSENQDRYMIFYDDQQIKQEPIHKTITSDEVAMVLCDGISAFKNASKASEQCLDTIYQLGSNRFDEWVERSNYEVAKLNSGCTLVGAKITNGLFEFVNVGDSLIYYIRNNQIYQLAQLHTLAYSKQLQKIEYIDEQDHHTLVCYIGNKKTNFKGYRNKVKLQKNDRIIICSDGLSEVLNEEALLANKDSAIDLIRTVKNKTSDNVTVIVVEVLE